jgi:glycosyltransferase involved in cell wall biosynthesis
METKKYSIAMVTDYFYPSTGGIESHVKTIGEELCKLGHTVVVITHKYKKYCGIVNLGPLIVYYLDIPVIAANTTIPTLFTNFFLYKEIFTRHKTEIVHGHQSISNMCMEAIYHANSLNIKTVLTDHSVFETNKFERIVVDAISNLVCKNIDRAICVSNVSKINTHERTKISLDHIKVIPNGIIPKYFYPKRKTSIMKEYQRSISKNQVDRETNAENRYNSTSGNMTVKMIKNNNIPENKNVKATSPKCERINDRYCGISINDEGISNIDNLYSPSKSTTHKNKYADSQREGNSMKYQKICNIPEGFYSQDKITVVVISRLVFRKGIDLLIEALPLICKDPRYRIIIVGDGPKKDEIEQKIDENDLHRSVTMLGEKTYKEIPDIMRKGDIFLNTSLTETFCMTILEAASCGLLVVSTNVGGIREVLPENAIYFCKPTPEDICLQIFNASEDLKSHLPNKYYRSIIKKYNWTEIAKSTVLVYDEIPEKDISEQMVLNQFRGPRNFLYRVATWVEFFLVYLSRIV